MQVLQGNIYAIRGEVILSDFMNVIFFCYCSTSHMLNVVLKLL